MFRKKKIAVSAGLIGTALTGVAIVFSWKSRLFQDWKKQKIEDWYFNTRDEKDIAWG